MLPTGHQNFLDKSLLCHLLAFTVQLFFNLRKEKVYRKYNKLHQCWKQFPRDILPRSGCFKNLYLNVKPILKNTCELLLSKQHPLKYVMCYYFFIIY